ncbi:MAG: hypothetical protein K0S08_700 [Gammaproteobacteria bacterium]|jgi:hypothetical protein|nr:hypothetical protein [Gammaproteobacteria bacterium]
MIHIKTKRLIYTDAQSVSELFWDIRSWTNIWNPIEKVNMLYEDTYCQEFMMNVVRDNKLEIVRTIRLRQKENCINFFTPIPPPMMTHHHGSWRFVEIERGQCLVEAERHYSMFKGKGETNETFEIRTNHFKEKFHNRLNNILNKFAEHFDKQLGNIL